MLPTRYSPVWNINELQKQKVESFCPFPPFELKLSSNSPPFVSSMSESKKNTQLVIKRQANALSNAAYSLPRNSKRLIYLCLDSFMNTKDLNYNQSEAGYELVVSYSDYIQFFGDNQNIPRDLRLAAKALRTNGIIIYTPELDEALEKAYVERNWINGYSHEPKAKRIVLFFHPFVVSKLELNKGTPFTKYALKYLTHLDSPNAMRLYETICQWRTTRTSYKFNIQWFIERYQLPKSYKRVADFRKKFMSRAIEEINKHTDIEVTKLTYYNQGKHKNAVTDVEIFWREKSSVKSPVNTFEPTLEQAIKTYTDLINNVRLPSIQELENLGKFLLDLGREGFDLGPEFWTQYNAAMLANNE